MIVITQSLKFFSVHRGEALVLQFLGDDFGKISVAISDLRTWDSDPCHILLAGFSVFGRAGFCGVLCRSFG